jgi:tetratricopeptide (TPR) repeat protein
VKAHKGRLAPLLLLVPLLSCALDAAERAYYDALRGEETGMGRTRQVELLDRAVALQPRRAWYRETRAIYLIDLREFDRASADLDTAVVLADRPYLHFLRGLVTCERGDHARSIADFDAAIRAQPKNTQFYRGRSLALSAVGRYGDALADAEHLVATVPQQAESFYARGVARSGLGQERAAIEDFDNALRERPELIYPLRARARSYERLGDSARAAEDRELAARLEREHASCALCLDPFRY